MLDTYCLLDDVKTDLDMQGTQDDEIIQNYILDAKAFIDAELGYSFGQSGATTAPVTRLYTGRGRSILQVDPILQVVQVQIVYPATQAGVVPQPQDVTWDVVASQNDQGYAILLARNFGVFPIGILNIQIAGVWGRTLDTQAVPPPIARANRRLAVHWYRMRDTSYADTMLTKETGTVSYRKDIPQDVQEILKRYRPRSFRSRSSVSQPWQSFTLGDW